MRIYIIGFMGSGKSTFGRKLSKKLGYRFTDTDSLLSDRNGLSIGAFFEKYGQKRFREEEHRLLNELIAEEDIVIATGGGIPCFSGNMEIMNQTGITVYMQLSPAALYSRLSKSRSDRPLLRNKEGEVLQAYISSELERRERFYLKAKIVADGLNISPALIAGMLKHFG